MNRKLWQDRDGHPSADLLLLHLEDELEGRAAEILRAHVDQCAACRKECEQLQLGASRFTAFRDSVVVPMPAPRTNAFHERLLREEEERSSASFIGRLRGQFRINTPRRLAVAFGGVSLCLIVWISLFLSSPRQSVYASQLLDDARSASDSLIAHSKVLNQKVRLRRGSLVIERSVHHGRPAPVEVREPSIDSKLQQNLDLAHVDLNDPLNANDFAAWRAALSEHTDTVQETAQGVIITTRATGAAISEGSLTLSRSGWRPIARSVEVRGEEPIEISEVSYDISDSPSMVAASPIGALAPSAASNVNAAAAPVEVSTTELETSELDLREAFHSIGADVSAAPEIGRSEQTVLYHASTTKPGEMEAIREAASRIPHVKETEKQLARLAEPPPLAGGSGAYTTTPPLAAALEAKLGDAQAVAGFLESLRSRSTHVLAEAAALDALGKRYSVDAIKALPPELRGRVNRLAASMLSSLQHDSADYVKALSPTLDEMAHERNIAEPSDDGTNLPGCLPWQQNAALAQPQLQDLAKDVSLLFVANRTEKPVVLTSDQLLSDSLRARLFLDLHLMSTCQLFGAN
ncbi:MAG: hypothetical protein ABSG62_22850 [Terracidiphilus sp.]|jgi:hypothetical protein